MRSRTPLLLATLLFRSAPLAAQQASPYVPIDGWVMPYVEHLIRAGVIADPDPLTRPLRRAAIAAALAGADTAGGGAPPPLDVPALLPPASAPASAPPDPAAIDAGPVP